MASKAAWLNAAKEHPFEIKEAEKYTAGENEILVENRALAINPIDGGLQKFAFFPLQYPTVLGHDVAGEVVEVGPGVTKFKKGDRVLGLTLGLTSKRISDNGFQTHTIISDVVASKIPDHLSYEKAAVVPLGMATAACGLFQDAPYLQLDYPTEPAAKPNGKTIIVWGGSSSVGSQGIQLARAAGYEVLSTASPHNFDFVKKVGASQVFDYKSPTIVDELVSALEGKTFAGALDSIGGESFKALIQVIQKTTGKGTIATTKGSKDELPEGITQGKIFGTTLKDNAVGNAIFTDYLPKALAAKTFVPSPEPEVVGHGLESLQGAIDQINAGVSAKKLVVTL